MKKGFLFIMLCIALSNNIYAENLGRVAAGTTVIASDSRRGRAFSPGKLIDGNPRTFWQSLPTAGEKFLEFNWRQVFTIDELSLEWMYQPGNPTKELKFWDIEKQKWQSVPDLKISSKGKLEYYKFKKVKTEKIRIYFNKATAGFLRIKSVAINSCDPIPPQSQWKAKWLWTKEAVKKISVRTSFEVKNPAKVQSAWVQLAADDVCYPYLNGKRFGTAAAFYNPRVFNMKPLLKKGINYFTASATDAGGARGFIAEIVINYKENGKIKTMMVHSDKTWNCQKFSLYALQNPTVEKGWKKATVIHNSPPDCPWGEVRHVNMAHNPDVFEIKKVSLAKTIKPGKWLEGSLEVLSASKPTRAYAFELILKNTGTALNKSDLRVGSSLATLDIPTDKWEARKTYQIPFKIWVDDFAPNGDVGLYLQVKSGGNSKIVCNGKSSGLNGEYKLRDINIKRLPKIAVNANLPDVKIKKNGDAPALYVNGEIIPQIVLTNFHIGYRTMHEYSKTGIKVFRVGALGNAITVPEKADALFNTFTAKLDQDIDRILRYVPDAYIIVCPMLRTDAAWVKRYPDEMYLAGDGTRGTSLHSAASGQWRKDAAALSKRLVKYIESKPWGSRVIAYTFMGGGGGEFHQYGKKAGLVERDKAFTGDHSPVALKSFRKWLKKKYANDAKLQKAWNNSRVSFATAKVASKELVAAPKEGSFFDPRTKRDVIDYWDWYCETNADLVLTLCKAGRKASSGTPLMGGFYGYWFHACNQYPAGSVESAHGGFNLLVDAPEVDFISLPYNYFNRYAGTSFFLGMMYNSLLARNKLSFNEFDNRTWVAANDFNYGQNSVYNTIQIQRRDIGMGLCNNIGWWWLDFSSGAKGQRSIPWYDYPEVISDMTKAETLYKEASQKPFKNRSEIAVFFDFRSSYAMDIYSSIPNYNSVYNSIIQAVPRIGAPSDFYNLDDIKLPIVQERYKLYIFVNAWQLSEDERRIITEKLQRDGKTLLWLWAPGYVDENKLSLKAMNEVTGFDFAKHTQWEDAKIKLLPGTDLTQGIKPGLKMEIPDWHISYFRNRKFYERRLAPIFYVKDKDVKVGGNYTFNNKPAFVYKKIKNWNSVYWGLPSIDKKVLRNIAKVAGVHIYWDDTVASFQAGGDFICLHGENKGAKSTLKLPEKYDIYDAISGKLLKKSAKSIDLDLKARETRIIKIKK
jgi:Beta-galactosidase